MMRLAKFYLKRCCLSWDIETQISLQLVIFSSVMLRTESTFLFNALEESRVRGICGLWPGFTCLLMILYALGLVGHTTELTGGRSLWFLLRSFHSWRHCERIARTTDKALRNQGA